MSGAKWHLTPEGVGLECHLGASRLRDQVEMAPDPRGVGLECHLGAEADLVRVKKVAVLR